MRAVWLCSGMLVTALLGACGDKPQALEAGKKKPDTQAYQGQGDAYKATGWTNGDKLTWETQIKARTQGQNEYSRTAGN
jgi:hypothetical protein